ncbi:beta-carotene isomerase D27, chloroplastic isoform X2 [Ricinus communis]|uniref:beta-carotene isomerase D27, chloroplastic isoform X2 n=1 Tax=Ricinus communis TaxID=3988 RepID=UPI00201A3D70|nr:beta-carotene isomerase D27, chloroplastic isoform X2 [Ricinus communis]
MMPLSRFCFSVTEKSSCFQMKPLALLRPLSISVSPPSRLKLPRLFNRSFRISCSSLQSEPEKTEDVGTRSEYKPGFFDDFFLTLFRNKMVAEVGWDSEKAGYDGLIEVANRLMLTGTSADIKIIVSSTSVRSLQIAHISFRRRQSSCYNARVTAITCQWLMGTCTVNSIDLPDGSSCESGVFVERCKYLEESKCVGICVNTCKLPTQAFFKDYMGVPLLMEPNFTDYSCQFKFGVLPPQPEDDSTLKEPCLEACPIASRRQVSLNIAHCPKA